MYIYTDLKFHKKAKEMRAAARKTNWRQSFETQA